MRELDTPVWSVIVTGSRDAELVLGGTAGGEGGEWLEDWGLEGTGGVVTRDDMVGEKRHHLQVGKLG